MKTLILHKNPFTGALILKDAYNAYIGTFNSVEAAAQWCKQMGYTMRVQ